MISANQAREIANEVREADRDRELVIVNSLLKEIFFNIKDNSLLGKFSCTIGIKGDSFNNPDIGIPIIESQLEELGYSVNGLKCMFKNKVEFYELSISWEEN